MIQPQRVSQLMRHGLRETRMRSFRRPGIPLGAAFSQDDDAMFSRDAYALRSVAGPIEEVDAVVFAVGGDGGERRGRGLCVWIGVAFCRRVLA